MTLNPYQTPGEDPSGDERDGDNAPTKRLRSKVRLLTTFALLTALPLALAIWKFNGVFAGWDVPLSRSAGVLTNHHGILPIALTLLFGSVGFFAARSGSMKNLRLLFSISLCGAVLTTSITTIVLLMEMQEIFNQFK